MAELNFPDSPSPDDTYTSGGRTWTWNGETWIAAQDLGGADTEVLFNDSDVIGSDVGFTYDKVSNNVFIANSLNMGHASDTTIVRVSAGRVSVEGANVVTHSSTDVLTNKTLSAGSMTEEFTATVTVAIGDLCYLNASGEMDKADADAEATADTLLGIATEAITAASSGTFLLSGKHTTTGLTAGSVYYVSTTLGDWTATAPSATADIVRIIGYALSTTVLFFNPSASWVEIT